MQGQTLMSSARLKTDPDTNDSLTSDSVHQPFPIPNLLLKRKGVEERSRPLHPSTIEQALCQVRAELWSQKT